MRTLILLTLLALSGCNVTNNYKPVSETFYSQQEAVVAFYKSNYKLIESLSTEQELLGYAIKCGNKYQYTNAEIGGLRNVVSFDVDMNIGWDIVAFMHTHPLPPKGMTVDHFSPEDLHLAKTLPVYMFSLEKNILRVTVDDYMKWGKVIGTINKGE